MKRLLLGASVLILAFSACGGSHKATSGGPRKYVPTAPFAKRLAAETKPRALAVTVPRVLRRYDIRGGGHMVGTRAAVIGALATDDPGAHYGGGGFANWSQLSSGGPPANKVAFKFSRWEAIGPMLTSVALRLHLPLSLHQPWFREHLKNGRLGYRWGYLRFDGQIYEAMFWSGRNAPPRDRAAVLSALAAVHPTR
jgi:hypothetical protein